MIDGDVIRKNADDDHVVAHEHSSRHRDEILRSELCGCLYCLRVFSPGEIGEWIDEDEAANIGTTAICPHCGIDSVIGSMSGFPIEKEFLRRMKKHWF